MRAALLVLFAVAVAAAGASPAWAGTASHGCSFTGTVAGTAGTAVGNIATKRTLEGNELWCYRYVAADGTTTITGPRVTAPSMAVWFDADLFQTVTTTARLTVHFCPQGEPVDSSNPLRSCPSVGELDGTEGDALVQDQITRLGPGRVYFVPNVACEAGDTCQIVVQAEGEGAH
jgi:hypothetical protein